MLRFSLPEDDVAWYNALGSAFEDLIRRRRLDSEMDEEMRHHIEMEARRNAESGMTSEVARRSAVRAFGGVERYKEEVRDARGAGWMQDVGQDVRYAARSLRRRPAFTVVAALTLALGIGATTALFGVVKAVLIAPLPYGDPEGIAVVWSSWRGFERTWVSYDEYEAYETEIPAFAAVGLFSDGAANLTEGDEPERVRTGFVMHQVFPILGVAAVLGRGFTAEEDRPGGPPVAVLGYGLWQRRFGGDPSILGRDIQVNGQARTVVGIMPAGFRLPLDFGARGTSELWLPLATTAEASGAIPGPAMQLNGGSHGFYAVARLADAVTAQQANTQLNAFFAQKVAEGAYTAEQQFRAFAVPIEEQVTGGVRDALLIVFAAVGFVLLIACANVAGLLMVRGEQRRRELAVRVALGAGARRLVRQLLTEAMVLAAIGGALGVALAVLGVRLVRATAPAGLPRIAETSIDPGVLLFAVGAALLAAFLSGVLPALQASGVAPGAAMRDGARGATTGRARLRWRQAVVAIEVALAVVLVTGAGLMIRTVANLLAIDTGFRPEGVLTMRLSTPAAWYPDAPRVAAFHDELRRRVAAIPGVQAVGAARILPLATDMGDWGVQVDGYVPPPNEGSPADWQVVTPGYFEAMGLRLVAGRFLDERDAMDAPLVLIVNRGFVSKYFAGREPLGGRVRISGGPSDAFATVVGVVDDVRHNGLTTDVKAQFYAPHAQFAVSPGSTQRTMSLVVRTTGNSRALVAPVRSVIRDLDSRLPVSEVRTMEEIVSEAIAAPSFARTLLGLFGVLALVLSAIGIFGIVSQVVAARAQELGIRAALGATPGALVRLTLGTGVRQTVVGLSVGVIAAIVCTRAMIGLLHGVAPFDPVTLVAVLGVTGVVAIGAALGPAWRAGRTDPMSVMHEG
ncbi:MAG TPA: ABC transporter permease [Gemmatimonadaceae bacterium]|nr:ABC transporter permease [Gemmatimonadaceae bacterium]